jgi:hypothetical protein
MALTLLTGPANAGKVALLLDRYLADLPREPVLIVPNRSDVERVERDLLGRVGALLGGSIGTFEDVFERIAADNGQRRPVATDTQRALVLRRVVSEARLQELAASARFGGFAEALASTILTGWACGMSTSSGATPQTAWQASSIRGTGGPSTPTALRISPGPSGACSRRSPGAST